MCGIVGFFCANQFAELQHDLPLAAEMLSHRGPDDDGLFLDASSGIGLAHRRLSILDLSCAGHQPMHSSDGEAVIVFNGEIYNYKRLRSQLQRLGHSFQSNSDTEVILNAYRQWGTACLDRFIGMFAFAIWDHSSQSLFLARDRLGIKPLYYHFDQGIYLFASELKALMAFSRFRRQVDPEAFPLYLHYQYIPAPRTIFQRTFKLEPGHYIVFDGKAIRLRQWWRLPEDENQPGDASILPEKELLLELDRLLTQAVSDRLISDVPLGALLSGGIDSSIVVALMQKANRSPVKTFSIGFEDGGFDEAPWARQIAKHLGTDHKELYVSSREALNVIPRLPELYDEPFADSSAIPTYLVSHLTRERVTVALSGDGGDEQFAGYMRYWITDKMAKWRKWLAQPVRDRLKKRLEKISPPRMASAYLTVRDLLPRRLQVQNFPDKWEKLINQLACSELLDLYRMAVTIWSKEDIFRLTGLRVPESTFETAWTQSGHLSTIQALTRLDQRTYLPDAMLTKVDRASMAVGLEIRVPLLDHRIVEFTSRLPDTYKYRNGTGKYLLKEVLYQYVPRQMVERPKMGFGVPLAQWLRSELNEMMNDFLSPMRLRRQDWLDATVVDTLLKEHSSGRANHQHRLWALLMWAMWRERWLN